ncbi:uncharacterized protein C2orf92-like isoform X2 [Dipodomys merriami]|uniref:uncharacterized protein C2orf92-like isoform X2 n=1 Tax=Dipodomys merriami TaxID=94247 RepID=UPI003855EC54
MSGAVFLSFVFFLDYWLGAQPHPLPTNEGSDHKHSSSSNNLDDNLEKIFDEILLQVFPSDPYDTSKYEAKTAGRLITRRDTNEGHFQTNSLNNSDFASSAVKREEHLAKIFDEILLQVFPKDPHHMVHNEARTTGRLITKKDMNEEISVAQKSPEPESFLDPMDKTQNGDINEKKDALAEHQNYNYISEEIRDKEFSLFNRHAEDELTTQAEEIIQETVSPDIQYRSQPCGQLMRFLQRNIVTAAIAVACILAIIVLLLLMLSAYLRRKRPLCPPANMTYNIFIMNGKSWWQKSQDKTLRKFRGKVNKLKNCSCV